MHNAQMRMPMPQPGFNQNIGFVNRFGRPSQTEAVVSNLSSVLDSAEITQLREFLDSDEKLHQLLDDTTEVHQLQAEREMQLAGNRSLADYNMKQGPTLSVGKERLRNLYQELKQQNKSFESNKRNLDSLSSQYKPDTLMALLQTSVAQTEETSEKTADSFLDGEMAVDEFLEKYLKERTCLHVRRTKVDKLKELMRRR